MAAYYNEFDPYAAEWLRNLIAAGHIAPGEVDNRSIEDVRPDDLRGFEQCHFFAGIGVWSYALRLAGWPDDRPVWTGSCPCQPFSVAGAGAGVGDERHLWPSWFWFIEQCRPPVVFGEQVEAALRHGWLDLVQADMEGIGYAVGAVGLPAASVGAPHIRQRLWFVADRLADAVSAGRAEGRPIAGGGSASGRCGDDGLDYTDDARLEGLGRGHSAAGGRVGEVGSVAETGEPCGLADADGRDASAKREQRGGEQRQQQEDGGACGMAYADRTGSQSRERDDTAAGYGDSVAAAGSDDRHNAAGPTNGHWRSADWLFCRDGKFRPVEPGTFPLVNGASACVGRLRAYGNAIVPQVAAEVIAAYMECRP